MAEKGLTLKVLFQAIDEMSGALKTIGVNLDNFGAAAKRAGASAKAMAAIATTSIAGVAAGSKGIADVSATINAAVPLDEALTRLQQIAPAIDRLRATQDAANQVSEFGVASLNEEVDALTRAMQLYGKYGVAVKAVDAANRLAAATHAPVIDALNQTAAMARSSGQSIDTVSDKLAAMWKAAGGAGNLAQVERAWGMAKSHGENLEHFLAVMAEAQKAGISGRSLSTYYEETSGKAGATHWSQGTRAIHALLDKQSADIAALQAKIAASEGVAASLAATSIASPAARQAREAQISAAETAVRGSGVLKQAGAIDDVIASIKRSQTAFELASPKVVTFGEDAFAAGSYVAKFGGELMGLALTIAAFNRNFPRVLPAAAAAAAPVGALGGLTAAATLGGKAQLSEDAARRAALVEWNEPGFKDPVIEEIKNWWKGGGAPATAPTTINVTHSPTVSVTLAGGDATPEKTATAVKAALDSRDRDLELKLKNAVDRATTARERSAFP
jgi:hypothetical protein